MGGFWYHLSGYTLGLSGSVEFILIAAVSILLLMVVSAEVYGLFIGIHDELF